MPVAPWGEEAGYAVLEQVIRGCLHPDSKQRIKSYDAQRILFDFMTQQGWSTEVSAGRAQRCF